MELRKPISVAVRALFVGTLLVGFAGRAIAGAGGAESGTTDLEVTGEHRGYTNDQLFLRISDEKEMTFLVRIPGDKEEKWHKDFQTLSRITVTYHQGPNDKLPVATAIRTAK